MKQTYEYQGKSFSIDLTPTGGSFEATLGGKTISVELIRMEGNRIELLLDGEPGLAYVSRSGSKRWVTINSVTAAESGNIMR